MTRCQHTETRRLPLLLVFALALALPLAAADAEGETGEAAIAASYLLRAETAIAAGRPGEAETILERAMDYSPASSDLAFLLARLRLERGRAPRSVLEAARESIETGRWNRYSEDAARLIEAEAQLRLLAWNGVLESLARISPAAAALPSGDGDAGTITAAAMALRLRALLGMGNLPAFRQDMAVALEAYPMESGPVRIFFDYASSHSPDQGDAALMETILHRLPLLLARDPDLAWRAAPFIRDPDDGRRLVAAYRANGGNDPAAIPAALNLGLLDEDAAITELFTRQETPLDRDVILAVFELLRHDPGRDQFRRNLAAWSGVITEDRNGDGWPESWAFYRDGALLSYRVDRDQDGTPELALEFEGGFPVRGFAAVYREADSEEIRAELIWEQYPWLRESRLEGAICRYRPLEFALAPVDFTELAGTEGFVYPLDRETGVLSRRSFVMAANFMERPSREFPGGTERIQLSRGMPLVAAELLNGRIVSVTEYLAGRKRLQRVDLDLDGRMETVRRFRRETGSVAGREWSLVFEAGPSLESSESDWDGDGVFETGEEYFSDGTVIRFWDFNRDRIRDHGVRGRE